MPSFDSTKQPPRSFDGACSLLETIVAGSARGTIADELSRSGNLREALLRLRDSMRSHAWKVGDRQVALGRIVKDYDGQTRADGFHVLHDWDGKADTVNDDTIPVDVLHYVMEQRGRDSADRHVVAVLIDYYFAHLLSLLSLRIWDEGNADDNLDRLNRLVAELQGPNGSGQRFVDNAETLVLIATSHFEAVEVGYGKLLDRVKTLNRPHRTNIAVGHAASMGSHLRFGFEATYARDTTVMRDDNAADYPWLCFALLTALREYARLHEEGIRGRDRDEIVEALLNGLSADPRAFIGQAPPSLSTAERDRAELADLFHRYAADLLPEFERLRPCDGAYSPLAFFFNFSHNVLKGIVVDALLRGRAWDLTFNDLLTTSSHGAAASAPKEDLAKTLMGYARRNPDRIRGRLMPVIVYDPATGREAFTAAMRKMRASR